MADILDDLLWTDYLEPPEDEIEQEGKDMLLAKYKDLLIEKGTSEEHSARLVNRFRDRIVKEWTDSKDMRREVFEECDRQEKERQRRAQK